MALRHPVSLVCCAVLLSGCINIPSEKKIASAKQVLAATPVCCAAMEKSLALPLPMKSQRFDIDAKSKVMQFGTEKSYFMLFELPAYTQPYSVTISSIAAGGAAAQSLFVPRFTLYDQSLKSTREFQEADLRNRGFNLERTIFINPSNAQDRYLAVHSSSLSSSLKRAVQTVTNSGTMVGGVYVNWSTGHDSTLTILPAPTGTIEIEVSGLGTN